jgi:outer membrane biosynthesis protein TonB
MMSTELSSRWEDWTTNPVVRALALSLLIHLLVFGVIEAGYRMGMWKVTLVPIQWTQEVPLRDSDKTAENDPASNEIPMVFVEVTPFQSSETPPETAKFYSSENSLAGNQKTDVESDVPEITGTQDKVPKTIDAPKPVPAAEPEPLPLQPSPQTAAVPEAQPPTPAETEVEPEPPADPGDMRMETPTRKTIFPPPAISTATQPKPEERPRYRKLADARAAQSALAGEKMKQEGGVKRYSIEGLDVRSTPFGGYDRAIIDAIQKRWFDLLDQRDYSRSGSGKVVLSFRLNVDGSVTGLRVMESQVNEILSLLCQRAVQDPAPYGPWPPGMRRAVGANYRFVRFTFHYE